MEVDHLYADLPCACCHQLISGEAQATMQTALNADAGYHHLHIGDSFGLGFGGPAANGYLLVNPVGSTDVLHLLEIWICPRCGGLNWADVLLKQVGNQVTLIGIEPAELNNNTLALVHFITDELGSVYERLVGVPLFIKNEESEASPKDLLHRRPAYILRPDWKELLARRFPSPSK